MHLIEFRPFTIVKEESKNTVILQIMKIADDTCLLPQFLGLISFHHYSYSHFPILYFLRGSPIQN